MKHYLNAKSSLLLLILSVLIVSCGPSKFAMQVSDAREKDKKAFVETTDGKITEANEAKLKSPLFGKSTIELDGEVKIPTKEVIAYQNSTGYYRRVAGQFAPRFKKGLINMYSVTEHSTYWEHDPKFGSRTRNRTRIIYYMQKGDQSPVELFTPDRTKEYVKDYAPAMEFVYVYDLTQKKVKMWSWINTTAVFGGLILAGVSASDGTGKVSAGGYAGSALFLGGIINGFVNKSRRAKNAKNLELAIDEYNGQVNRKRRK